MSRKFSMFKNVRTSSLRNDSQVKRRTQPSFSAESSFSFSVSFSVCKKEQKARIKRSQNFVKNKNILQQNRTKMCFFFYMLTCKHKTILVSKILINLNRSLVRNMITPQINAFIMARACKVCLGKIIINNTSRGKHNNLKYFQTNLTFVHPFCSYPEDRRSD